MNKVLVTGGHGFIASHTIEKLKEWNIQVVTNVRSMGRSYDIYRYFDDVEVYVIDNRDEAGMRKIVEQVDGVINLAGILGTKIKSAYDLDVFYDNNVKGSHSVIKACMVFETPLVQIGVGNYFEYNFYSNTKTAVERDVLALAKYQGLKGNVVRGLNAYGPRQKVRNTGKIIPTFITKALKGESIEVYGGRDKCGIMDMIYVEDLATVLITVLGETAKGTGKIFEAGTGKGYSVYDIAEMIIKTTDSKSEIIEVPMRAGESERSEVVAKDPYPIIYTELQKGLEKTIKYYAENHED